MEHLRNTEKTGLELGSLSSAQKVEANASHLSPLVPIRVHTTPAATAHTPFESPASRRVPRSTRLARATPYSQTLESLLANYARTGDLYGFVNYLSAEQRRLNRGQAVAVKTAIQTVGDMFKNVLNARRNDGISSGLLSPDVNSIIASAQADAVRRMAIPDEVIMTLHQSTESSAGSIRPFVAITERELRGERRNRPLSTESAASRDLHEEKRLNHLNNLLHGILILSVLEAALGAGIGLGEILTQTMFILVNELSSLNIADLDNSVSKASLMAAGSFFIAGLYFGKEYFQATLIGSPESIASLSYSAPVRLQARVNTLDRLMQSVLFEKFILQKLGFLKSYQSATYYLYKALKYLGNCFTTLYMATTWAGLIAMMGGFATRLPDPNDPSQSLSPMPFYKIIGVLIIAFMLFKLTHLALQDLSKSFIERLSQQFNLNINKLPKIRSIPKKYYIAPFLLGLLEGFTFGSFLANEFAVGLCDVYLAENLAPFYNRNTTTDILIRVLLGCIFAMGFMCKNVLETQFKMLMLKHRANLLQQNWQDLETYVAKHSVQLNDNKEFKQWHKESTEGTKKIAAIRQGDWPSLNSLITMGQNLQTVSFHCPSFRDACSWLLSITPQSAFMMISLEILVHLWADSAGKPITPAGERWVLIGAWALALTTHLYESSKNMRIDQTYRMIQTRLVQIQEWLSDFGVQLTPESSPPTTPISLESSTPLHAHYHVLPSGDAPLSNHSSLQVNGLIPR